MIRVTRFCANHLIALPLNPAQPEMGEGRAREAMAAMFEQAGNAFTAMFDGRPLFCGGAMETHVQLATLWCAFAPGVTPGQLLAIHRRVRRFVEGLPHRRVEALARAGNRRGLLWLAMLGFEREAALGVYFVDGEDAVVLRWRGDD